jgi:hypothetical protein
MWPKRHTALDKQDFRDYIRWQIKTVRKCNETLNYKVSEAADET